MPRKIAAFYLCYQTWLGMRFWNQTSDDDLAPKKNQSPEQEVHEIRQLLEEDNRQSEEAQC